MVASIPASRFVKITPSVVSAGGTGLDLCGLILTQNTRVPIGAVMSFPSPDAVGAFFGLSSAEYGMAVKYFLGFDNSPIKPANLLFFQYAENAVPAYLRGGPVSLSIAALQALAGVLTLTINGTVVTSSAINLTSATSYSAAAALITTALAHYDAVATCATTSGSPSITVSAVASGALAVGQSVSGAGIPAGTTIIAGSGTAWTLSANATATNAGTSLSFGQAICTYDSVWGAFVITGGTPGATGTITVAVDVDFADALGLTADTGAIPSQGSAAMTPAGAMTTVMGQTQNFASFTTAWLASTSDATGFAAWNNAEEYRFLYVQWDSSAALGTTDYSSTAWGAIVAATYAAVLPLFEPTDGANKAAAIMGIFASIDFTRKNGRVNLAYRSQSGLAAGVSSDAIAAQLEANGVNYYGAVATAAQGFLYFWNGAVSGPFAWADTLVNEIWMTNAFQLALMELLTTVTSVPYNDAGSALITETLAGPIADALHFGAIRAGVTLSAEQIVAVNQAAGADVASTIQLRGWYLQVGQASPQVRAARGSPPITFWYTDGGSVQRINLNSAEVQ